MSDMPEHGALRWPTLGLGFPGITLRLPGSLLVSDSADGVAEGFAVIGPESATLPAEMLYNGHSHLKRPSYVS